MRLIIEYTEKGLPKKGESNIRSYFEETGTVYRKRHSDVDWKDNNTKQTTRTVIHSSTRRAPGDSSDGGLARYYVWWPNIDKSIETYVKRCQGCQENRGEAAEVPLYSWNIPEKPWERIDFAGPYRGRQWLILIDAYAK